MKLEAVELMETSFVLIVLLFAALATGRLIVKVNKRCAGPGPSSPGGSTQAAVRRAWQLPGGRAPLCIPGQSNGCRLL